MSAPSATSPIDRVDDLDRTIGTVTREAALQVNANFRTAHVLVYDHLGRVLLQQLSAGRSRHPCRWGSSVAAYLYSGESYRAAAARRAREELGLELPLRYRGKVAMRDESSLKFVAVFTALSDTAAVNDPGHIARLSWWSPEALAEWLEADPTVFTPTFVEVHSAFGQGP